jgi:fatty-acyl-CoA synthase
VNLADFIDRNAAFAPQKPALRFPGGALTYAAFARRIDAAARALSSELGVRHGDRVAVLAANHSDTLVLLYACARLGAMLVPLNWRLAVAEQLFILADCGARALVVEQASATAAVPFREASPEARVIGLDHVPEGALSFEALLASTSAAAPREPAAGFSDPLLIVYTSGTTGRPKGAVLRQEALFHNAVMSQHMHGLTCDDHVLAVLPFFHVGGLNIQTTPALQQGATVTIHPRFTPEATLAAIACEKPSLVVLVPATLQALIEHPAFATTDLSGLRRRHHRIHHGAAKLVDAFEARGVPVLQVYGSTETCPIAIYTRLGGDRTRSGSTGLPGLCCEARIVDDRGAEVAPGEPGEVLVRGRERVPGLLGRRGRDLRGFPRRLVSFGRHRDPRPRRLRHGARPQEEHDHLGRREHLPGRDRARAPRPSGGGGRRRGRAAPTRNGAKRPSPTWSFARARRRSAGPSAPRRGRTRPLQGPARGRVLDALPRNALGKVQHFGCG